MKNIRHPRTARDPLLRVLTDGCVVDIEVGLSDADGHHVTRVDVLPEGESRGGDRTGHIWYQDGPRIIRLEPGEAAPSTDGHPEGSNRPVDLHATLVLELAGEADLHLVLDNNMTVWADRDGLGTVGYWVSIGAREDLAWLRVSWIDGRDGSIPDPTITLLDVSVPPNALGDGRALAQLAVNTLRADKADEQRRRAGRRCE